MAAPWLDRRGALCTGGLLIVFVGQDRGKPPPDVPFGVAGEHAQEDVCADAVFAAGEDRPDSQTPGLDLPEDLLNLLQAVLCASAVLVRPDAVGIKADAGDQSSSSFRSAVCRIIPQFRWGM